MSEENKYWMKCFHEIAPGTKRNSEVLKKYKVFNLTCTLNSFDEMGLTNPTEEDFKVVSATITRLENHDEIFSEEVDRPKKLVFLPSPVFIRKIIRTLHNIQEKSDPLSSFGF